MPNQKAEFIAEFERIYEQINIILTLIDPTTVVYPESGWRVQDLLGHLAVWYDQRIKALSAYQQGTEHQIVGYDDMHAFNGAEVEKRKTLDFAAIQTEWQQAHQNLIAQLNAISDEKLDDEMMFPWGARGPMRVLLEKLVAHGDEHYIELVQVGL